MTHSGHTSLGPRTIYLNGRSCSETFRIDVKSVVTVLKRSTDTTSLVDDPSASPEDTGCQHVRRREKLFGKRLLNREGT